MSSQKFYTKSKPAPAGDIDFLAWNQDRFTEECRKAEDIAFLTGVNRHGNFENMIYPQVCEEGNPSLFKGFLGNQQDKCSQVSHIFNDAVDLGWVQVLEPHSEIPVSIRPTSSLKTAYLAGTNFENAQVPMGMCLVPILAAGSFEMSLPKGKCAVDETEYQGTMRNWINLMEKAVEQSRENDVENVIKAIKADPQGSLDDYVRANYDSFHIPDTTPFCTFCLNPEDELFPDAKANLAKFFVVPATPNQQQGQEQRRQERANQQPTQQSNRSLFSNNLLQGNGQTVIFKSGTELEQEKEAEMNIASLALFFVVPVGLDLEKGTVTGLRLPKWSKSFQKVLDAPASVRPERLRNLLMTIFSLEPETRVEKMDPMFTERNMQIAPMTLVKALLACNFQFMPLLSMHAESNSINLLNFLSQNLKEAVARVAKQEQANTNQRYQGMGPDLQKQNKSTLDILGMVRNMKDLPPCFANVNMIVSCFVDYDDGVPLVSKVMEEMMDLLYERAFKNWSENQECKQPQLPFTFISVNQLLFSNHAKFAKNVLNIQVAEDANPDCTKLRKKEVENALRHISRFLQRMRDNVVDGVHDKVIVELTPNDMNPDLVPGARASMQALSISEPPPSSNRKNKATATPVSSPNKNDARPPKKARAAPKAFTACGLFHFKDGLGASEITSLLPSTPECTICANFGFHKVECPFKEPVCNFKHIKAWKKLTPEHQIAILEAAHTGKKFWLDKKTFERQKAKIPRKYLYLLGDANGPQRT